MKPEDGFNNMANVLIYFWVQGYMSAANITTLEADSEYIDLAKFDEKSLPTSSARRTRTRSRSASSIRSSRRPRS